MRRSPIFDDLLMGSRFAIGVVLLLSTLGCSNLTSDRSSLNWFADSEPTLPTVVLPIWTDTVLHQTGKPAVRGFGARVYFYEREGGDPIKVDGSITVYLFDGEDYEPDRTKPLRKYVITADQLEGHHSVSDLGHSYSVWVPWDQVGGPSKTFSLITRFDGRHGGTAVSDSASKLLPGSPKKVQEEITGDTTPFKQVSFEYSQDPLPEKTGGTVSSETYSLTLPRSFQRHLNGASTTPNNAPETKSEQQTQGINRLPVESGAGVKGFGESVAPPAIDYPPSKSRAQTEQGSQRDASPSERKLLREGWRSGLERTPRSAATRQDSPSLSLAR